MKGYFTDGDYWGYLPDKEKYQRFETEDEYKDYFRETYGN